jgi:tyrosyl-tRNA synthetase
MSVSDDLMWRYYLLLTDLSESDVAARRAAVSAGSLHPKVAKIDLAKQIVKDFHSANDAERAAGAFEARFARGEIQVDELSEVSVAVPSQGLPLAKLLVEAGLATSSSEASRKIQQGGVKVDRQRVIDVKRRVLGTEGSVVLEAGRRAVRVRLARGDRAD